MCEVAVADKFQKLRCHRRWQIVEIGERSRSKKGVGGQIVKLLKIETTLAVERDAVQDASPPSSPDCLQNIEITFAFTEIETAFDAQRSNTKPCKLSSKHTHKKHLPFSTALEDLCLWMNVWL